MQRGSSPVGFEPFEMSQHLRNHLKGQEGFTLIELLVVVIMLGILGAIAVPTFLSQTQKAYDTKVIAAINSADAAEATYLTDHSMYVNASSQSNPNPLTTIEPTLADAFSNDGLQVTGASSSGYTVTANDPKNDITFSLAYHDDGSTDKSCYTGATSTAASRASAQGVGACSNSNSWGG